MFLNFVAIFISLTYYIKVHRVADRRCGRYLALVLAGVPLLWAPDFQRPLFGARLVLRFKALVGSVRVPTHCQQVDVTVTHP